MCFSYQCPGLFYTETVISYLSLIVLNLFSTFAIVRFFIGSPVLAAKQVCHPHIFFFFSFIYVICLLWGPVGRQYNILEIVGSFIVLDREIIIIVIL